MEQQKIERQIQLAVREAVIRCSRDEVPDPASLALALASGETAQSLCEKANAKIEKRDNPPAKAATTAPSLVDVPPAEVVAEVLADDLDKVDEAEKPHRTRAHHGPTHHNKK